MISSRPFVSVVVCALLAASAGAAEPAKKTEKSAAPAKGILVAAKTNAPPAKPTPGVGVPGEILLSTPSLDATWQDYRGRLALFSLTDRRTGEPMLISQDAFSTIVCRR